MKNQHVKLEQKFSNHPISIDAIQKAPDELDATTEETKRLELPHAIVHELVNDTGLHDMKETAKALKLADNTRKEVGRNGLFKILRHHGVLKDNNEPYAKYAEYFEVKYKHTMRGVKSVTMVNSMGLAWLTKLKIENKFNLNCLDEKTTRIISNSVNIDGENYPDNDSELPF